MTKIPLVILCLTITILSISAEGIISVNEAGTDTVFVQDFTVKNQNYHFVDVVKQTDKPSHWSHNNSGTDKFIANDSGYVQVARVNENPNEYGEAWCVVGPMDLTNTYDIEMTISYINKYGALGKPALSTWISKYYEPNDGFDPNLWTILQSKNDLNIAWGSPRPISDSINPTIAMDTAGVYIGIKFDWDGAAIKYNIHRISVSAKATVQPSRI
ncbi:hypothetical protein OAO55_03455, partial [Bacteroidales bacterium]|nr:hypothetical protein [Bacteroidales bacterium]